MFIICPKCGAKYKIPAGTTLESGQKLKCSACDFVFQKGEEAPLPLTETEVSPASTPVSEKPKAFSEPLYHESDLNISPKDSFASLPEAFQPISAPTPQGKGFWILLPLYAVIIVVLCIAGWSFRELLKPSFAGYLPRSHIVQTAPPVVPVRQTVKPTPKLPKSTFPKQEKQQKPTVKAETIVPPQPAPKVEKHQSPKPIVKAEPIVKPKEPKVTPPAQPKLHEQILPETDTFSVPDESQKLETILSVEPTADEPLFEVVADKQPAPKLLTVQDLDFKINQNPEGISQLLIDGTLKNTGDKTQPIPMLTAFVFNKDGHVLTQKQIYVSETEMAPDQVIPFYTGIVPAPDQTHHVDIKF